MGIPDINSLEHHPSIFHDAPNKTASTDLLIGGRVLKIYSYR